MKTFPNGEQARLKLDLGQQVFFLFFMVINGFWFISINLQTSIIIKKPTEIKPVFSQRKTRLSALECY